MDIKTAIRHCQALVSFHLSAEEHECADEDDGRAISKVLDTLAEATVPPEGNVGDAVRLATVFVNAVENADRDIKPETVQTILGALARALGKMARLTEDRDNWRVSEEAAEESNVKLRDLAKQATDDLMAVQGSLEAAGREVARLKDELAKSTQAEVEATNACRVLEADAMRCSRSAEQAKADVARLWKKDKELREQLALNGQCEMRQLMEPYRWACKYRRELTEEVARLREEINSYKDLAVRLGVVTEERDAARAGTPVDEFLQEKVDELRAECDDMTGQFTATAAKLREAQEELEASRKARVDLSIGFDNAIKRAEKAEHERDIWMATRLGDANDKIKLINTKVAIVTAELRKRTEETEAATKVLKDYIVYAFHEAARDPARMAYSALIELEKRVATGKFGSAPCPSCKTLRERDMVALITTYRDWNFATFGDEKPRTERIVEHIRSELEEVLADPSDLLEWVDVMLFAWQGALRAGHSPEAIVGGVRQKMAKNKGRRWSNDILPKDDA